MTEQYDADYYLRGQETGKSLYKDYRWLPELTIPMVKRIVEVCGIVKGDRVLDFGCARGYTVKALHELGYRSSYGYDVSEWAIENADPSVYHNLTRRAELAFEYRNDWIIAKDVLEHIPFVANTITQLMSNAKKGLFVVVPLADFDGGEYVVPDYEKDVTHLQRHSLLTWVGMFLRPGWSVEASYRVVGVKDNYAHHEKGNGFITARRL